ncbi:unnamed protein product [Calypogeia fissa]
MAAVSRNLPRGLGQVRSVTLRSVFNLEKNASGAPRSGSRSRQDENSCDNVCYRGEFELNNFYSSEINPLENGKVFDLRSDRSRGTVAERCLESFRSTPERQNYALYGADFAADNNVRRIAFRAPYYAPSSACNFRSVWTAVSDEDKLRPEVDEEELDLKDGEENLETATAETKRNAVVAEDAQTSMYASPEDAARLTTADVNKYLKLSVQDLEQYFGEGLPSGLLKEFDETKENAFFIRNRVLQLFERFQKCLADTGRFKELKDQGESVRFFASKPRQCLLEGFVKGGKTAALAMLVHWARMQGWLVFYVPNGRDWTSVGMYYKNAQTGLFDTPIQAKTALEGFLKSHEKLLVELPCRIMEPLPLGEGAGTVKARGPQQITLPEGATLKDLVERGVSQSQAAVSCVVRLREELGLVKEVPVLIAIDEFNSWFTFSSYHESTGTRSRRPIHAAELSMVNAFRTMEGPLMMATAFSHSSAVGRLPVHLPGVPKGVRFSIPRYNLEETRAVLKYYHSRKVTHKEPSEEDIKKLFYLTNGNGEELRNLVRLL